MSTTMLIQSTATASPTALMRTILSIAILIVLLINLLIGSFHPHFVVHSQRPQPIQQKTQDASLSSAITTTTTTSINALPSLMQPPPLESLVQGKNVVTGSNVSWLLDFAIIGFPKCGTSSVMFHLQNHSQVQIFGDERCDLSYNKQAQLVRDLYNLSTSVSSLQATSSSSSSTSMTMIRRRRRRRGIKCPLDLENTQLALPTYRDMFPHTKFIVGIRHPVLWMESFYNFRIHNGYAMPHPNKLTGKCFKSALNVCAFRSNFHLFLSSLGKTNMSTNPDEYQYVAPAYRRSIHPVPTKAKVFLYEVSQLRPDDDDDDDNNNNNNNSDNVQHHHYELQFRIDLQHFLQLQEPIQTRMLWFKPGRARTAEFMVEVKKRQIDICRDEYMPLRTVLLQQAINASQWITRYFMQHADVTVSSPEYFKNTIMASWQRDPCFERQRQQQLEQNNN